MPKLTIRFLPQDEMANIDSCNYIIPPDTDSLYFLLHEITHGTNDQMRESLYDMGTTTETSENQQLINNNNNTINESLITHTNNNNNNKHSTEFHIVITKNNHYSFPHKQITIVIPPSLVHIPDARSRALMLGTESQAIALLSLNAYVSTLGGGYFLCRRVDVALQMAYKQHQIAVRLGNPELAGQCRVHVCYILMQVGKLHLAAQRLHYEKMEAQRIGSEKHAAVVHAAIVYLVKLNRIQSELRKNHHRKKNGTNHKKGGGVIHDDYYRQRFVQEQLQ
jgi:hypothetical protein